MPLDEPARVAIETCLAVGPDESVAVVTDEKRRPIGSAIYDQAATITDDVTLLEYPVGGQHGEEPPAAIASALAGVDVFLAPTTKSLSHTRAREAATEAGARGATLPGITESVFEAGMAVNYEAVAKTSEVIYEAVCDADTITITSPAGTDITITPGDRPWKTDTGLVHEPGSFSNLPAGEVFISPASATGRVVVDGTMEPHGRLDDQTVAFEVQDGQVTSVEDESLERELKTAAEKDGDAAYNLAELGIGTNHGVTELVGSVLLDEKAAGTVHLAIGDDASIGGETEAPIHLDGIVQDPTVYVDGDKLDLPTEAAET